LTLSFVCICAQVIASLGEIVSKRPFPVEEWNQEAEEGGEGEDEDAVKLQQVPSAESTAMSFHSMQLSPSPLS